MNSRTTHSVAVLVNLASGAALALLALAVDGLGPLHAVGWWSLGSGLLLSMLAFPSLAESRDALLPGSFAALALGLAAHALDLAGVTLVGTMVILALAVAPALSRVLRMTMPAPVHVGTLSGGILGVVVFVSVGSPDAGTVLAVGAGLALAAHTVSIDRVIHRHRVVGLSAAVLVTSGVLLLGAGISSSGFILPARDQLPILLASIAVAGVTLPLLRVRIAQRLGVRSARHHLPWFAVGAALAGWWTAPLTMTATVGTAVLLASAWIAGTRPTGIGEAEGFRIGP